MKIYFLPLSAILMFQLGCLSQLKTRADVDAQGSRPGVPTQKPQQAPVADSVVTETSSTPKYKLEERDEQLRALYGRVEEAENRADVMNQEMSKLDESRRLEKEQYETKIKIYEEAVKKLESEIAALKTAPVEEEKATEKVTEKTSKKNGADARSREDFYRGEDAFKQKKWKDAIVHYQKYREDYPKGKLYPDATYKIGICFTELGLKDESKAFFEEVKSKFPKSSLAKKASEKLKSL